MSLYRRVAAAALLVFGLACTELDPFRFQTFELADGRLDQAYADTIRTTGGHGYLSMRVIGGQLPPGVGLRVEGRDGVLHGLPVRTGDFQFTVEARDSSHGEMPRPADIITQGFAITVDSL
ncbi:hypothetical protein JXB37_06565 [candidate division WOR-3 bacterium]|nr:hypothetical protein [candidate division WOR-3 bacterium]